MTKERIEKLLKAGANVVLTTKGIDDMALKVRFVSCAVLFPSCSSNFLCILVLSYLLA